MRLIDVVCLLSFKLKARSHLHEFWEFVSLSIDHRSVIDSYTENFLIVFFKSEIILSLWWDDGIRFHKANIDINLPYLIPELTYNSIWCGENQNLDLFYNTRHDDGWSICCANLHSPCIVRKAHIFYNMDIAEPYIYSMPHTFQYTINIHAINFNLLHSNWI